MFGPKELDLKNTYEPNLSEIGESAKRTLGEANEFLKMSELRIEDLNSSIKDDSLDDKSVYDASHAIASILAIACETYLKAIYISENNLPTENIEEIWSRLTLKDKNDKDAKYKKDKYGHRVYYLVDSKNEPKLYPDGTVMYTFEKVDENGDTILAENGNPIYVDREGNEYAYEAKGRAAVFDGHNLDRLIDILSPESALLLETRMLTIPIDVTEKNVKVSILDILQKKGLLQQKERMSKDEYVSWIDRHKRTFEDARYAGQKNTKVNVEFLFHLAMQLKAVAEYKISPKADQYFDFRDDDLENLSPEIKEIFSSHSNLLSNQLVKLIITDDSFKAKVVEVFSGGYELPTNISKKSFYKLIQLMDTTEILFVLNICFLTENYYKFGHINKNKYKDGSFIRIVLEIAEMCNYLDYSSDQIVNICVEMKTILKDRNVNEKINSMFFQELFYYLKNLYLMSNFNKINNNDNIDYFKLYKNLI